ncbi:protein Abitram-like [Mya arenaria]|uniref:protein Abitram-like n=1 Tax=Mya arenaria TaxID=6604 RepID=UPI0022E95B4A|nr:protein Abitram-like [Mya arenaria]
MDEVVKDSRYLSVVERYYTPKYYKNTKSEKEDVCILVHSNKICVVTLAEWHPVVAEKKEVVSVDYQFDHVNRLCNRVTGKGKKGAQNLHADSALCRVKCSDGSQYQVPCGLKCQLLETNGTLKNTPSVLTEKPNTDGYLAVVLPKLKDFKEEMCKLLAKDSIEPAVMNT